MEIILFENEWCTIVYYPNGVETSVDGEDTWIDMYEVVLDGEYCYFSTKAEAYEYALQMTTNMTTDDKEEPEQEQEEDIPF